MNEYNFEKTEAGLFFELDKEIYSKEMIDSALKNIKLQSSLEEDAQNFNVTLRLEGKFDPTVLGLEFNDLLIAAVSLKL